MTETVSSDGTAADGGMTGEEIDQAKAVLSAIVDKLIASNPEAAQQFGQVFADGSDVGAQWIGYNLTQRAPEVAEAGASQTVTAEPPEGEQTGPQPQDQTGAPAVPSLEVAEQAAESLLASLDPATLAGELGVDPDELAAALSDLPDGFFSEVASAAISELGR